MTTFLKSILLVIAIGLLSACGEDLTPEQHLERAKEYLQEKKLFEGIIELKNALQKEGNLPEARWLLGEAYMKLDNGSLAHREFSSARSLGFSHEDLELNIFRSLNLQGKFQEVLDKTASLQASDNSAELQVIRGDAQLGLGLAEEAETSYQNALSMDKNIADAYKGLARLALGKRDLILSEQQIDLGLAAAPENDDLWVLKGMLVMVQGKAGEAEKYFTRADEIAPYNRTAKIGMIRSRYSLGKFEEAKPPLEALEARFNHVTIRYLRAYLEYQHNKDTERAKEILQGIMKTGINHPESLLLLSNILFQEGNLEQVIGYMERFTGQYPGYLPAVKLLAVAYLGQKKPDKTIDLIEGVLENQAADDKLYSILGTAYIRSGNIGKATEYLELAAELNPEAANIRAQLAFSHLAAGETDLAVSGLEDAMKLNPNFYSANIMLILTHIRSKDFDKAIEAADHLRKNEPDNPLPLNLLGTAYAGNEDYDKAREFFNLAIEKKPDYSPAKFNLANLDIQDGDLDSAARRYRDVIKHDETNPKAWVGLAKIESKRGNSEKMLEYLQQARKVNANSVEARVLLARYYKNTFRNREMLEVIEEAFRLAPHFTEVIFLTAQAHRLNRQYEKARKNIDLLANQYPDSIEILMEKSLFHMDVGEYDSAEQTIGRILEQQADHEQALLTRINLYLRTGRPDEAKSALESFAAAYPDSLDLHLVRGDLALYEKDYSRALQHYRKAMESRETVFVVFRLVNTYLSMGDNDSASAVLEKWVQDHPEDLEVKLVLASRYQQNYIVEQAKELYEEVLRDNPDNMVALNNLAWLYMDNDNGKAMELAERAFKLSPEQPEVMDTFGWVLIHDDGQLERGLKLIKGALDKKPKVASIRYHYAYGLAEAGERRKAITELEKALELDASFEEAEEARALLQKLQN